MSEMKTAHELLELFDLKQLKTYDHWIAAIQAVQLDAFKTGMTRAAEIVLNQRLPEHPTQARDDYARDSIISTRDALTEKDI